MTKKGKCVIVRKKCIKSKKNTLKAFFGRNKENS